MGNCQCCWEPPVYDISATQPFFDTLTRMNHSEEHMICGHIIFKIYYTEEGCSRQFLQFLPMDIWDDDISVFKNLVERVIRETPLIVRQHLRSGVRGEYQRLNHREYNLEFKGVVKGSMDVIMTLKEPL